MIPALLNKMMFPSAAAAGLGWDAATVTNVTLSNGNLTATSNATGPGGAKVAASSAKTTGKYYFEFLTNPSDNIAIIGVALTSANYGNFMDLDATGGVGMYENGAISTNGSFSGDTALGWDAGYTVGIAVDLDNRAVWFKTVSQADNWNGDPSFNPATNTGGVALLAGSIVPIFAIGATSVSVDEVTANFGASAFSGTVPSGFTSGWPV